MKFDLEWKYRQRLAEAEDPAALRAAWEAALREREKCEDIMCIGGWYSKQFLALRECDKKASPTDRFICRNNRLHGYMQKVQRLYEKALSESDKPEVVEQAQREWKEGLYGCREAGYTCLTNRMRKRIAQLEGRDTPLLENIPEGPYVIVSGKGVEVCEAYRDNLNSFQPRVPAVCGRPVNKGLEGFEHQPNWHWPRTGLVPNGKAVGSYYNEMTELLWERDVNPVMYHTVDDWPSWQGTTEQLRAARERFDNARSRLPWFESLSIATLDLNNDGTPEHGYLEMLCNSRHGSRIAVITDDWERLDREKTEKLMPHPPFGRTGRDVFRPLFEGERLGSYDERFGYTAVEDASLYLFYDTFEYKGTIYFDSWWWNHPSFKGESDMIVGRLKVFKATPQGTEKVCSYRFNF